MLTQAASLMVGWHNVTPTSERPLGPEEIWDRFIDALDRGGQAGTPAGVLVPTFPGTSLGGKRFGDLSKDDVKGLSRLAGTLGRRGETIVTIWDDMQRKARGPRKGSRKS